MIYRPLMAVVLAVAALGLPARAATVARAAPPARAATPARAAAATSTAALASAVTNYLLGSENADGGLGPAPGQPSDQLFTGWAALGLASAGQDLNIVGHGKGLMDYVRGEAGTRDIGSLERTILVVRAAGLSARSFGGHDLIAALRRRFDRNGSVSDQVNLTAFAVLALRADGAPGVRPSSKTLRWMVRQQGTDGGFGFAAGGGSSDVDDTGAVLEALAGQRAVGRARARAVAYLRRRQDRDGGFPADPGLGSNAQSTAWAIQGLDAAGVSPSGLHRGGAVSPLAYLDSLVGANGAVRYSRAISQTPVWVTGEALMAMEGKPLPIAAPGPRAARSVRLRTQRSTAAAPTAVPPRRPGRRGQ
jgi:Prenyltransferase and squalene oxidase repeat